MIETLLAISSEAPPEPTGNVLFLFDQDTQTDLMGNALTSTLRGGAIVDREFLINGKPTLKRPNIDAGTLISLDSPLDITTGENGDWTIEWAQYDTMIPANAYAPVFLFLQNGSTSSGVQIYWGNAGFGERMLLQMDHNDPSLLWRPPETKSQSVNKLMQYALVYKDKRCKFFINGVPKLVQNHSGGQGTVVPDFPITQKMSTLKTLYLGQFSTGFQGTVGHTGNVRISDYARYTRAYNPKPF